MRHHMQWFILLSAEIHTPPSSSPSQISQFFVEGESKYMSSSVKKKNKRIIIYYQLQGQPRIEMVDDAHNWSILLH